MDSYQLMVIGLGIVSILSHDAIAASLSRIAKINYAWFSIISIMIYFLIGLFAARGYSIRTGMGVAALIGLVDATAGFWISKKLNAYVGDLTEEDKKFEIYTVLAVIILAGGAGWIGALFA